MIGSFVGTLTPAQGGDLIRALYLREKNPESTSLATVMIDRIFDIALLIALAASGSIIISLHFGYSMYSIYPAIS